MDSGNIVQSLREARGLTQAELAQRAGVSANTVWRLESEGGVRRTNARLILEALHAASPLTQVETDAFCAHTGLTAVASQMRSAYEAVVQDLKVASVEISPDILAIADTLKVMKPAEARLVRWLLDLIDASSVDRMEMVLRGAGAAMNLTPPVEQGQEWLVWHKPTQHSPGLIEQQVVHYSRKPNQREQEGRKAGVDR